MPYTPRHKLVRRLEFTFRTLLREAREQRDFLGRDRVGAGKRWSLADCVCMALDGLRDAASERACEARDMREREAELDFAARA